jgi:hypothetical protein
MASWFTHISAENMTNRPNGRPDFPGMVNARLSHQYDQTDHPNVIHTSEW